MLYILVHIPRRVHGFQFAILHPHPRALSSLTILSFHSVFPSQFPLSAFLIPPSLLYHSFLKTQFRRFPLLPLHIHCLYGRSGAQLCAPEWILHRKPKTDRSEDLRSQAKFAKPLSPLVYKAIALFLSVRLTVKSGRAYALGALI